MKKLFPVFLCIVFTAGCAAPLSDKTCTSLQGVSMRIMTDRQAGLSKEAAVAKLAQFTSGKPDAKSFSEVATSIIEAAYNESIGITENEKSEIVKSFVSGIENKCLSGNLNPSYNPMIRVMPAVQ